MGWFSSLVSSVVGTVKAIVKNPVTAIAAVGLAIYAPALGARMLGSMVVSNLLAPKPKDPSGGGSGGSDGSSTAQQGNPQNLSPNPANKLPMVYGKAFISPTIIDAKISSDNQTMWYVLALCEAPDAGESVISFGDIYYGEKKVTYTSGTGRVTALTSNPGTSSEQVDTKIADNMWMYFFNGSGIPINGTTDTAYTVLGDSNIAAGARWVSGSQTMSNTIFMVVKLVYSSEDAVTGLENLVVEINNNQNGITDGYKPGSAMMDYLLNGRYGANLSYDQINASSFTDLDTYADEVITYTPVGGGGANQPRYRLNGVVDTSQSIMTNLMSMADSCDSYIQFNEATGKWSVVANKSFLQAPNAVANNTLLFGLDNSNIIGGINISPLDLNSTPNAVESSFYNAKMRGKQDYAYAETPDRLKNFYEPPNKLQIRYQFVNDSVRAQYLSNRKLEQCRADYIVDLTTDYSAIGVNAGDVVNLTYEPHGGSIPSIITGITGDGSKVTVTYNSTLVNPYTVGQSITIEGSNISSHNGAHIITDIGLGSFKYSGSEIAVPTLTNAKVYSGLSWTGKPFRVVQIQEQRDDSGVLMCKLQLSEYSEQVYDNWTIEDYAVPDNNYMIDPGILGKPAVPTIDPLFIKPADNVPTFQVKATTPATGVTMAMEFWYGPTDAVTDNNFKLWDTQYNSSKPQYGVSQEEVITVSGLETGTWYWRVRAIGATRKSEFSDSVLISWAPSGSFTGDTGAKTEPPDMVVVPLLTGQAWPDNTRGIMPSGGVYVSPVANPGSIRISFSASVYADDAALTGNNRISIYNCIEVWKSVSSKVWDKKIFSIKHNYSSSATAATDRIHAIGLNTDLVSTDGGMTWSQHATPTSKTIADGISLSYTYGAGEGHATYAVGPWQLRDGVTVTPGTSDPNFFAGAGNRNYTGSVVMPITYNTNLVGDTSGRVIGSFNGIAIAGGATSTSVGYKKTAIAVGDNGLIYFYYNGSDSVPVQIPSSTYWKLESSGVLKNLYDVYSNKLGTGNQYTTLVVGGNGTILKSVRAHTYGSQTNPTYNGYPMGSWSSATTTDLDGNPLANHLYAVGGDNGTNGNSDVWIAVGEKGTLLRSADNGDSWTMLEVTGTDGNTITSALRGVKYGNGKWVAVGDSGTIITSSDAGLTWSQVNVDYLTTNNYYDRNFYSVDWVGVSSCFVIGGDNIILRSSDSTIDFTMKYSGNPAETYTMKRLWYRGSLANLSTVGTPASVEGQLLNGQTVASTIIDTDYKKGDELSYYLVIGNIKSSTSPYVIKCGGAVITATEYKK